MVLKKVQRYTRVLGGWHTHVLYLCALAGSLVLLINMLMPISQGASQLVTETSADAIAPEAPFEQPTIVLTIDDADFEAATGLSGLGGFGFADTATADSLFDGTIARSVNTSDEFVYGRAAVVPTFPRGGTGRDCVGVLQYEQVWRDTQKLPAGQGKGVLCGSNPAGDASGSGSGGGAGGGGAGGGGSGGSNPGSGGSGSGGPGSGSGGSSAPDCQSASYCGPCMSSCLSQCSACASNGGAACAASSPCAVCTSGAGCPTCAGCLAASSRRRLNTMASINTKCPIVGARVQHRIEIEFELMAGGKIGTATPIRFPHSDINPQGAVLSQDYKRLPPGGGMGLAPRLELTGKCPNLLIGRDRSDPAEPAHGKGTTFVAFDLPAFTYSGSSLRARIKHTMRDASGTNLDYEHARFQIGGATAARLQLIDPQAMARWKALNRTAEEIAGEQFTARNYLHVEYDGHCAVPANEVAIATQLYKYKERRLLGLSDVDPAKTRTKYGTALSAIKRRAPPASGYVGLSVCDKDSVALDLTFYAPNRVVQTLTQRPRAIFGVFSDVGGAWSFVSLIIAFFFGEVVLDESGEEAEEQPVLRKLRLVPFHHVKHHALHAGPIEPGAGAAEEPKRAQVQQQLQQRGDSNASTCV